MKYTHTKKLVIAALFAALTCTATMSIRIPTPGTGGYVHPGDGVVILCGLFLSPGWAFLAAGIGSCLADLLGGYFIYVPITLVIKGLIAFFTSCLVSFLGKRFSSPWPSVIGGGILDIVLVAGGYFLSESLLYGAAGAAVSVPANLIQGVSGLVIACVLYPLLAKPLTGFRHRFPAEKADC
ncbi:MAG: ECF transporter S component [Lachnospiraceae bacterium]|nr:ECF transporter S component [Lachnospiraceae bacterium]